MDMLGEKKDLTIQAMVQGLSSLTNEPLGHHLISYTVDSTRKTGRIDMARKLSFQRPRQTVSAALIAGLGSEDTLHWCLKSLIDVADEIVIADCGMSDEARRIAQQYDVKLITGSDPKEHGFETPRNEALAACSLEWALWIDTDEKLLNPAYLNKYLRRNIFNGYSLRQHHFAVDTTFAPDMPVRLFRRSVTGGENAMRFYGMIHEHPELGLNNGPGRTVVLGTYQFRTWDICTRRDGDSGSCAIIRYCRRTLRSIQSGYCRSTSSCVITCCCAYTSCSRTVDRSPRTSSAALRRRWRCTGSIFLARGITPMLTHSSTTRRR